jgi:hypothetical protein
MHERTYRFLIPPVLLLLCIASGNASYKKGWPTVTDVSQELLHLFVPSDTAQCEGVKLAVAPEVRPVSQFLGAAFAGAVLFLTIGTVIGTLATILLKLAWPLLGLRYEPIFFNHGQAQRFLEDIGVPKRVGPKLLEKESLLLNTSRLLVHGTIDDGVKDLLDRRWNTFNVSFNCGLAILLGIFYVWYCRITPPGGWYVAMLALVGAWWFVGFRARCDMKDLCRIAIHAPNLRKEKPKDAIGTPAAGQPPPTGRSRPSATCCS